MVIKKTNGYTVHSKKGKKLSRKYGSRKEAIRRLKQIEYWKHKKK